MSNPELLYSFDEKRSEFKPYGLTCELWMPDLMRKPDRHNEIELNYFTCGSITYLFQGQKITIPENSLSLFWGLVPHQIVDYTDSSPYFVVTIPLTLFLEWKLPAIFTDRVLKGEVVMENPGPYSSHDEFLFKKEDSNLPELIDNMESGKMYQVELEIWVDSDDYREWIDFKVLDSGLV
jgi:hypothetical protein